MAASLRPRVSAAVKQTAEAVAEDAEARVEYGPAPEHIRDNIEVVRHEAAGYLVVVDVPAPEGPVGPIAVEFGSVHAPAYPFLIPSAEDNRETGENLARAALRGL